MYSRTKLIAFAERLVTLSVSLAIVFLVTEVALSVFLPQPIEWRYPQESYLRHPELIHTLKPNQQSFTHSFPVRTNSYGLRDREYSLEPAEGRFRILCVGDSLTFGNGVPIDDTYPKQLERMLNDGRLGTWVEVINAGVPAYDSWQEVLYLRRYGLAFKPDLVVVGVYANDVVPRPTRLPQAIGDSDVTENGIRGLIPERVVYILKRSRTLLLLRDRSIKLANAISASPEFAHKLALLNGTFDLFIERGWGQIQLDLEELSRLAKDHGFHPLLVLFPMPDQLLRDYPNASYPSRFKSIADSYNIGYIDLMPIYAGYIDKFGSLFIDWDGHPNAKAYEIAANEIKRYVLEKDLAQRPGALDTWR